MMALRKVFLELFLIIAVCSIILGVIESGFAHNHNDMGFNLTCSSCHCVVFAFFIIVLILGSMIVSIHRLNSSFSTILVINLDLISPYLRAPPITV